MREFNNEFGARGRPDNEADAYAFLERLRWGDDGPTQCPHCGSNKGAWYLKPKDPAGRKSKGGSAARSQRRVWKCKESACRRQFSVLTNTVMHATKMPVRAWIGAVFDLCQAEEGVAARDISQQWGMADKSAGSMLDRIEQALAHAAQANAGTGKTAPRWREINGSLSPEPAETEHGEPDPVDSWAAQSPPATTPTAHEMAVPAPDIGAETRPRIADSAAAERIKSDVARALSEVHLTRQDAPRPAAEALPNPRSEAKTSPISADEPAAAATQVPRADQVAADVQRVLAEVFDEPPAATLPESARSNGRSEAPKHDRARPGPAAAADDLDAAERVAADVQRALAEAFDEPISPTETRDLANDENATTGARRPLRSPEDPSPRPSQPVDNLPKTASGSVVAPEDRDALSAPKPTTGWREPGKRKGKKRPPKPGRTRDQEQGRDRAKPVREAASKPVPQRDQLGDGWLRAAGPGEDAGSHPVDEFQGQLLSDVGGGVRPGRASSGAAGEPENEAPIASLGPSWADDDTVRSSPAPTNDNQLRFFPDSDEPQPSDHT